MYLKYYEDKYTCTCDIAKYVDLLIMNWLQY